MIGSRNIAGTQQILIAVPFLVHWTQGCLSLAAVEQSWDHVGGTDSGAKLPTHFR